MMIDSASWQGIRSRRIRERIVIECDLESKTPAHFGNGDSAETTDMPLLVDPKDGKSPLLTGSSIAGALRSYLRSYELGLLATRPDTDEAANQERQTLAVQLFGGFRADADGLQSALIVDDARAPYAGIERRDGVSLNPASRTAAKDKLFGWQVWQAGTIFRLRFELLISSGPNDKPGKAKALCKAMATALTGLADGGITLGARKRRGYGQISVGRWWVKRYDLATPDGLIDWLERGRVSLDQQGVRPVTTLNGLYAALGTRVSPGKREIWSLNSTFGLNSSILIRSGGGRDDKGPDMVHLTTYQPQTRQFEPILSGTSLAGALRTRATRILSVFHPLDRAIQYTEELFGRTDAASRLIIGETQIQQGNMDLIQNRVSIDRFTGGARDTALFSQRPVFGTPDTIVSIHLKLINPRLAHLGLVLLLLKDLWTGDLPIGGEISVGRGRLYGRHAVLLNPQNEKVIEIEQREDQLRVVDGEEAETWVAAVRKWESS